MSDPRDWFERFEPGRGSITIVVGAAVILTTLNLAAAGLYDRLESIERQSNFESLTVIVRDAAAGMIDAAAEIDGCESMANITVDQVLGPNRELVSRVNDPPDDVGRDEFRAWMATEVSIALYQQIEDPKVQDAFMEGWTDENTMRQIMHSQSDSEVVIP